MIEDRTKPYAHTETRAPVVCSIHVVMQKPVCDIVFSCERQLLSMTNTQQSFASIITAVPNGLNKTFVFMRGEEQQREKHFHDEGCGCVRGERGT